jgi:hypothetical protein
MAGTGLNKGFYFDPEVFSDYMQELPKYKNAIILSGIVENDATIGELIGEKGNVGTMPFYLPLDTNTYAPRNYDGTGNNTPYALAGGKQSFMVISRMASWSHDTFTKELTGANPIQDVANKINGYEQQVRQGDLMASLGGVLGATGFTNHTNTISITTGNITDANKISAESAVETTQLACGDMADRFSLVIMHSAVYARLKALQLIDFAKYTDPAGITKEIVLPIWNGMIVSVDDRGTVDTSVTGYPVYTTIFAGRGLFRGYNRPIENPYYSAYDPLTNGGVDAFYEKQQYVLHPNGFSLDFSRITTESPTTAELGTTANWSLAFDEKVIPLAAIKTNG